MSAIIIEQASRFLDFSHLTELEGLNLLDGTPFDAPQDIQQTYPAADFPGVYVALIDLGGNPIFYRSNGTVWYQTGTAIAGGLAYPGWDSILTSTSIDHGAYIIQDNLLWIWEADDGVSGPGAPRALSVVTFGTGGHYADIGALIDASLADTYARNTDTGRLYLTDSGGYPNAADVAVLGTMTEACRIDGDETQDSDLTGKGWSEVALVGDSALTYEGDFVRLSVGPFGGRAALRRLATLTGDWVYSSGYVRTANIDTDAHKGFRLAWHVIVTNGTTRTYTTDSDNGARTNFDSSDVTDLGEVNAASSDGQFVWAECLHRRGSTTADTPCIFWVDHRVAVAVSSAHISGSVEELRLGVRSVSLTQGQIDWKNFRWYTIA